MGIFLGYHLDHWNTDVVGRAQVIYVGVGLDRDHNSYFELRRSLGVIFKEPARLGTPGCGHLARKPLGFEEWDPTLRVVVRGNEVREIWWDGKQIPEFCGSAVQSQVTKRGYSCAGPFGFFVRGGGQTWVTRPKFQILTQKSLSP